VSTVNGGAKEGSPNGGWRPSNDAERQAVHEQLERILASPPFRSGKRCVHLLRFVVERTLTGQADQLKERTLGVEVFGREPHYDTSLDNTVRTAASDVRKRIAQYYLEPGREAEIKIDLPSGSYVPEFRIPIEKPEVVPPPAPHRNLTLYGIVVVALATLLAVAGWLGPWSRKTAIDTFWSPILRSTDPVLLCLGGVRPTSQPTASTGVQNTLLANLSVREYLLSDTIAFADAITLARLVGLLRAKGKQYRVRRGGAAELADLREGPVVLIGGFNNRWTRRLTGDLRFTFEGDPGDETCWIRDRQNPTRMDWKVANLMPYSQLIEDYALISRVWDATTDRLIVVVAGIAKDGTLAAGEFLANPTYMESIAKKAPRDWERKNLQVVIGAKVINGSVGPPRVLAVNFW